MVKRAAVALALVACGDNIAEPAVVGEVFEDIDGDGVFDPDERPLGGVTVFVDLDGDGALGPDDASAVTSPAGSYRIELEATGPIEVRQQVPFGMASVSGGEALARQAVRPYIIGGAEATDAEYGFMAAVGLDLDGFFSQFCGGALIAPRFVVTAGHCSEGVDPAEARVMLGSNDLDGGQLFEVAAIEIHPSYNGDVTAGGDIAVWQLAAPADFEQSPGLATVELAAAATRGLTAPGRLATTVGWGVSDLDSVRLQEVHVPITSDDDCAGGYPDVASFATQICAGVPEGGIDSCNGDSGGPLVVRDPERQVWIHAGVTSWGDGCALPGKPGVYAETAALVEWVRDAAREPSRLHRLSAGSQPVRADFGNLPNLQPRTGAIDSRVQLTALIPDGAPDGVVAADTPIELDFRILSDADAADLSCQLDPDGPGPEVAVAASCELGDNRATLPGYPDGAFRADLQLDLGGASFVRSAFIIAGSPSIDTATGALTDDDPTDPDFNSTYFIDHYELVGATEDVLAIVDIDVDFGAYIALYDADERDASGGGTLDVVFVTEGAGTLRFFPEPGKRYLLGISSLGESVTGSYEVVLTNNGTLAAVTL